jgi:hypothetical protein
MTLAHGPHLDESIAGMTLDHLLQVARRQFVAFAQRGCSDPGNHRFGAAFFLRPATGRSPRQIKGSSSPSRPSSAPRIERLLVALASTSGRRVIFNGR